MVYISIFQQQNYFQIQSNMKPSFLFELFKILKYLRCQLSLFLKKYFNTFTVNTKGYWQEFYSYFIIYSKNSGDYWELNFILYFFYQWTKSSFIIETVICSSQNVIIRDQKRVFLKNTNLFSKSTIMILQPAMSLHKERQ